VCGEFVSRAQLAVFTWQGCTLSVTGDPNYCYVGTTTPMRSYINLHAFLQVRNPPSP
jgi:polyribonucleotide 5'-hydroxyl-kinase